MAHIRRLIACLIALLFAWPALAEAPKPAPALPRSEETLRPGQVFRDCRDCPEMVVIPRGTFMMGSPATSHAPTDEYPQHSVNVTQFALGKYSVTRGEFAAFVRETGYRAEGGCFVHTKEEEWAKDDSKSWRDPGFAQTDQHPVVCVNWQDAKAYAAWLSRKTGKTYRLPSEAEREYAARAGTATHFFWGDNSADREMCRYANAADLMAPCSDGHAYTAPVGSFEANRFGLHDMSGNVWEWSEDCSHESYDGAPSDGSAWTAGGECSRRVLRGGAWDSHPDKLRSAARNWDKSTFRLFIFGFRLARTL